MESRIYIRDHVTPALRELREALDHDLRPLLRVLGRAGRNHAQKWYHHVNATHPNRFGAKRTNFWNAVADSVFTQRPKRTSVAVGIGHQAIAQKIYGGEIRAKRVKNLTIPLTREAYEHPSPRLEHWTGDLHFAKSRKGNKLLSDGDGRPQFLLKPSIYQHPDPDALPREGPYNDEIQRTASRYLNRKLRAIAKANATNA